MSILHDKVSYRSTSFYYNFTLPQVKILNYKDDTSASIYHINAVTLNKSSENDKKIIINGTVKAKADES